MFWWSCRERPWENPIRIMHHTFTAHMLRENSISFSCLADQRTGNHKLNSIQMLFIGTKPHHCWLPLIHSSSSSWQNQLKSIEMFFFVCLCSSFGGRIFSHWTVSAVLQISLICQSLRRMQSKLHLLATCAKQIKFVLSIIYKLSSF